MINDLDYYVTEKLGKIKVPNEFQPTISVVYPPSNFIEFERWFCVNYGVDETDRKYLPIFWTAYYVNNNYGQDKEALQRLQEYIDSLDKSKKYYTIIQYDDAILNDVSGLDLYQFNMSKTYDYPLPLIGQPHPFYFKSKKKYLANFVGGLTHPIREHAKTLIGKEGYYISFDRHDPYEYCKIISESVFTLCYRGYGLNSFRIAEALQFGSIPIYISDEFIHPHKVPFNAYGMEIEQKYLAQANDWFLGTNFNSLQNNYDTLFKNHSEILPNIYKDYYTYEGTKDKILKHLLTLK